MTRFTVDWLENKQITVAGQPKDIKEGKFIGEDGVKIDATIWRHDYKDGKEFPGWAEIVPGATFEANPYTKPDTGKITLYPPKLASTGAPRSRPVAKVDIEGHRQVQEEITKHVHAAQDRSAWMWAKNNAAMLVANSDTTKHLSTPEQLNLIVDMATNIYNAEPTRPF